MRYLVLVETSRDRWELPAVAFNPSTAEECRVEVAESNPTRRTAIVCGIPECETYHTVDLFTWPVSIFAAIQTA